MIIYKDIPCPIIEFKEPDSFLILYKGKQKWIYETSLGYGEIEYYKEHKEYVYKIDKIYHREKGPVLIRENGDTQWAKNGKLHRLDGPAVNWHWQKAKKEYWIEGTQYSEKDYWEKIKEL